LGQEQLGDTTTKASKRSTEEADFLTIRFFPQATLITIRASGRTKNINARKTNGKEGRSKGDATEMRTA
jgi:hypothetical protein